MNILMLTDRFPPEVRSSAHLFHDLAVSFQARGHEVRVITKVPSKYIAPADRPAARKPVADISSSPSDGRGVKWELEDGVCVRRVRWIPFLNGNRAVRAADHLTLWLSFALASRAWPAADVVLIYSPPLPLALAGGAYRRWYGVPFVLNVQDLYPQTVVDLGMLRNRLAIKAAEQLEWGAYRLAERIVVHSPGNREFLIERKSVPARKVRVIYNWVDVERIRPGLRENEFRREHGLARRFVVSFAGLMGYAQDLTTIIEAAKLLESRPEIVFLLVGEGVREKDWRAMVAAKGLCNVRFLPMQPRDGYTKLLAASDVCLAPLASELRTPVVPGKLQNIMASGRPVIATLDLAGDTSRIIAEAKCGYAIEARDVEGFRDAVLELYQNQGLARRFGASGRAYAERWFSLSASCSAYEQLFREILANRAQALRQYEAVSRDVARPSRP